jgi:protein TonB
MSARRSNSVLLWGSCFVLALCVHGAGAAALLVHLNENVDAVANAPVIAIELAPLPVAPEIKPTELPPGPQQAEAEPEPAPVQPVEKIELPPDPKAEPTVAVTPPPKPIEKPKDKKPKQLYASLASAPTNADQRAERAAAPAPGASSHDANAVSNWKSLLVATLERNKRYPSEAQSRGEHGVAQLAFSVDRRGGVHHARIARSSGSSVLDRETLAMLEHAAPLPPPPPEVGGAEIAIVVPIRYNIR